MDKLQALKSLQYSVMACRHARHQVSMRTPIQAYCPEEDLPVSISTDNTAALQPDVNEPIPMCPVCSYELGLSHCSVLSETRRPDCSSISRYRGILLLLSRHSECVSERLIQSKKSLTRDWPMGS